MYCSSPCLPYVVLRFGEPRLRALDLPVKVAEPRVGNAEGCRFRGKCKTVEYVVLEDVQPLDQTLQRIDSPTCTWPSSGVTSLFLSREGVPASDN
jgi:hypothetical protein